MDFECLWTLLNMPTWFLDHFKIRLAPFRAVMLVVSGTSWTIFGSIRGHLAIILASFWHHFGVGFGVSLTFFGPFWGHCCTIFGPFLRSIRDFWWFWEVKCKCRKMMQEKAKYAKFLSKFTKNMQNCAKRQAPFSAIKHLFCLKDGQIRHFNHETVQ